MKRTKQIMCITLALTLSLAWFMPTTAYEISEISIEFVRDEYAWGSMFVGGGQEGSFLIWYNDELLYESHAARHSLETPQAAYSVAKSVISALTGIALQLGYLESVEQKVIDFFPEAIIASGQRHNHRTPAENDLWLTQYE